MSFKSSTASTSGTKVNPPGVKEFTVKLARDIKKKYNVMQFNRGDKLDFTKCSKIVMERENNMRTFNKAGLEDLPTEGAGSEFGRERREEARRKKFGIISKRYNENDQPWLMRVAGKPEKKYKGKKEGLITENANYYLFTQQVDGTFHAIPVDSWYSFQQTIRHSTLNAEEAEEEFNRRDRSYNYFSLMVQKRLKEKTEEDIANPDENGKKKKKTKSKAQSLTIREDDDYRDLMTSEESSDSEDDKTGKKKSKKKGKRPARPKKKDSGSEAEEESDNGDFEGEEMDYMSEVSSDEEAEQQKMEMKGLDEEMKHIEDEEEEEEDEEKEGDEKKKSESEGAAKEGDKSAKKDSSSSGGSDDSDDSDIDDTKITSSIFMQKKNTPAKKTQQSSQKSSSKSSSRGNSRPSTPITTGVSGSNNTADASGDKATVNTLASAAVKLQSPSTANKRPGSAEPRPGKKARTESPTGSKAPSVPEVGLTEDVVRRYLMRKPMTTKDLLVKLNPKKTGLTSEEVVKRVTVILRKLNPAKLKFKDKMYWHIKDESKPAAR